MAGGALRSRVDGLRVPGSGASQPPGNLTPPTITRNGTVITCDPGDWDNSPDSFTFQHTVNGAAFIGATSQDWNVPPSAWGGLFGCEVVPRNSAGQGMPALAQEVYIGILDVLSVQPIVVSNQKMRAGYAGAPSIVRNSSNNPAIQDKDVAFAASGWIDNSSLSSHIGTGDGSYVTWYDQSVAARHFNQSAAVHQPKIAQAGVISTLNSRPALKFTPVQYLQTAAFNTGAPQELMTIMVLRQDVAPAFSIFASFRAVGDPNDFSTQTSSRLIAMNNLVARVTSYRNGSVRSMVDLTVSQPSIIASWFDATSHNMMINRDAVVSTPYAAASFGASAQISIGSGNNFAGTESVTGLIAEAAFFLGPSSAADRTLFLANRLAAYGL